MKRIVRNITAWLQEFVPMWQMKLQCGRRDKDGVLIQYEASEGIDWWLPRLKRRITIWNEEAGNPSCDKSNECYAYYVRLR